MDIRLLGVERLEDLLFESTNEAHAEDRGEPPHLVAAGVCDADRILMPVLRGAHGGLQDPPPYLLGNVGVPVELAERLLEPVERGFRDREVVGILEALGVRMLKDRSQGDRRAAAHLFGPVAAAQDGEQRLNQLIIDDREITCKLGGEKEIGFRGAVIPKDVEEHLPGTFGPLPGWRVFQGRQVHR